MSSWRLVAYVPWMRHELLHRVLASSMSFVLQTVDSQEEGPSVLSAHHVAQLPFSVTPAFVLPIASRAGLLFLCPPFRPQRVQTEDTLSLFAVHFCNAILFVHSQVFVLKHVIVTLLRYIIVLAQSIRHLCAFP